MIEVVVTRVTEAIRPAKLQLIITNKQHPTFYRPDALPVAQPTVSKHWRETAQDYILVKCVCVLY